jgi:hypothetical protein
MNEVRCVECHNGRRNGTQGELYAANHLQDMSGSFPSSLINLL